MVTSLREMFEEELRDAYDAEHQIAEALTKMAEAADSPALSKAFQTHAKETQTQIQRLEQVFDLIGVEPERKTCEAIAGAMDETEMMMEEIDTPEVLDAALVGAAQKVEHYEIASYGTLRSLAQTMGMNEAAQLLEATLNEEKKTDELLTKLALDEINPTALAASEADEEEGDEDEA